ncbi:MAG: type III-B CRISPR module-associated protein Cmr3 [Candidatus Goldbacteria bacterium]|nr:type III-B CRISPR module-associated protein Cmr3 [Candidatus Goldiibacteriota bacterium]
MEKYFEIKPLDIMFFRDGFPFSRGLNFFAKSLFPPNMGTIYNALRTMLLDYKNYPINQFLQNKINDSTIGSPDSYGDMEVENFILKDDTDEILIPPKDIVYTNENEIVVLQKKEFNLTDKTNFNINLKYIFHTEKKFKEKNFFIKKSGLIKYLEGLSPDKNSIYNISNIIVRDKRLGIKIDKRLKTAQNKGLYNIEYIKFANEKISFLLKVKISEDISLKNYILRLGGDTKIAVVNTINYNDEYKLPEIKKFFKIILKTPGIFLKNKYYPDIFVLNDNKELIFEKNGVRIKLVGMIIDKVKTISGFDLARNAQKEIYKAVPAGSLYICEIESGSFEAVKDEFYPKLKTQSEKVNKEGYNITIIGGA